MRKMLGVTLAFGVLLAGYSFYVGFYSDAPPAGLQLAFAGDDDGDDDGRTVDVNWRISGTFITGVQVLPPGPPGTEPKSAAWIDVKAKGRPGRADIRVVGLGGLIPSDPDCGSCPAGFAAFGAVSNPFVATFHKDGSQLYADLDPEGCALICLNFVTGASEGEEELVITGGTGKFEGATGNLLISFETQPIGPAFSAETGRIVGTIHLDRDRDDDDDDDDD